MTDLTDVQLSSQEALRKINEKMDILDKLIKRLAPTVMYEYQNGISYTTIQKAMVQAQRLAKVLEEMEKLSELKISHVKVLKEYI